MNIGTVVKHNKTKDFYEIVYFGLCKKRFLCFSWWSDVIIYKGITKPSKIVYVRNYRDFIKHFEVI